MDPRDNSDESSHNSLEDTDSEFDDLEDAYWDASRRADGSLKWLEEMIRALKVQDPKEYIQFRHEMALSLSLWAERMVDWEMARNNGGTQGDHDEIMRDADDDPSANDRDSVGDRTGPDRRESRAQLHRDSDTADAEVSQMARNNGGTQGDDDEIMRDADDDPSANDRDSVGDRTRPDRRESRAQLHCDSGTPAISDGNLPPSSLSMSASARTLANRTAYLRSLLPRGFRNVRATLLSIRAPTMPRSHSAPSIQDPRSPKRPRHDVESERTPIGQSRGNDVIRRDLEYPTGQTTGPAADDEGDAQARAREDRWAQRVVSDSYTAMQEEERRATQAKQRVEDAISEKRAQKAREETKKRRSQREVRATQKEDEAREVGVLNAHRLEELQREAYEKRARDQDVQRQANQRLTAELRAKSQKAKEDLARQATSQKAQESASRVREENEAKDMEAAEAWTWRVNETRVRQAERERRRVHEQRARDEGTQRPSDRGLGLIGGTQDTAERSNSSTENRNREQPEGHARRLPDNASANGEAERQPTIQQQSQPVIPPLSRNHGGHGEPQIQPTIQQQSQSVVPQPSRNTGANHERQHTTQQQGQRATEPRRQPTIQQQSQSVIPPPSRNTGANHERQGQQTTQQFRRDTEAHGHKKGQTSTQQRPWLTDPRRVQWLDQERRKREAERAALLAEEADRRCTLEEMSVQTSKTRKRLLELRDWFDKHDQAGTRPRGISITSRPRPGHQGTQRQGTPILQRPRQADNAAALPPRRSDAQAAALAAMRGNSSPVPVRVSRRPTVIDLSDDENDHSGDDMAER